MFYDPMIAKLVTHAATRDAAIDLQADALDDFLIDGIDHNIPFLAALMQHPRWRKGSLSTGFIAEEYKGGFKPPRAAGRPSSTFSPRSPSPSIISATRAGARSPTRWPGRRCASPTAAFVQRRRQRWSRRGSRARSAIPPRSPLSMPKASAAPRSSVDADWWPGQPVWTGMVHGRPVSVQVRAILNGYDLAYRGIRAKAHVYTEREAALAALMPEKAPPDTSKLLLCPMPGLVKAIHVAAGQEVKAGEALCVVEAMKMENILRAERDAVVKAVKAKPGDSLAVDAVIMEFA